MPRARNTVESVQITVSTTPQIREYLEELTAEGLYGKNVAETAHALISEKIRELRRTGDVGRKEPAP